MGPNYSIELTSKAEVSQTSSLNKEEFTLLKQTAFASPQSLEKMILHADTIEKLLLQANDKGLYLAQVLKDLPRIFKKLIGKVNLVVVDQLLVEQTLTIEQVVACCKLTDSSNAIDIAVSKRDPVNQKPLMMNIPNRNNKMILEKMSGAKLDYFITNQFGIEKYSLLHRLSRKYNVSHIEIEILLQKVSQNALRQSLFLNDFKKCVPFYFLLNLGDEVLKKVIAKAGLSDNDLCKLFISLQLGNDAPLLSFLYMKTTNQYTTPLPKDSLFEAIVMKFKQAELQFILSHVSQKHSSLPSIVAETNIHAHFYRICGAKNYNEILRKPRNLNDTLLLRIIERRSLELVGYIVKQLDPIHLEKNLVTAIIDRVSAGSLKDMPKYLELLEILLNKLPAGLFGTFIEKLEGKIIQGLPFTVSLTMMILNRFPKQFYDWYKEPNYLKTKYFKQIGFVLTNIDFILKNYSHYLETKPNALLFLVSQHFNKLRTLDDYAIRNQLRLIQYKSYLQLGQQVCALKCIEEMSDFDLLDVKTEFEIINLYRVCLLLAKDKEVDKFHLSVMFNLLVLHVQRLVLLTQDLEDDATKHMRTDALAIYNSMSKLIVTSQHTQDSDASEAIAQKALFDNMAIFSEEQFEIKLKELFTIVNTFSRTGSTVFKKSDSEIFQKLSTIYNELKFSSKEDRLMIINNGLANSVGVKKFDDILNILHRQLILIPRLFPQRNSKIGTYAT